MKERKLFSLLGGRAVGGQSRVRWKESPVVHDHKLLVRWPDLSTKGES